MLSFQGSRAVQSPGTGKDNLHEIDHHEQSKASRDILLASPTPQPMAKPNLARNMSDIRNKPQWSTSPSGSTLTDEPLEVTDIEKRPSAETASDGPVAFWSSQLNSTRRHVFKRYSLTRRYTYQVQNAR
jgi:hypothetical protein